MRDTDFEKELNSFNQSDQAFNEQEMEQLPEIPDSFASEYRKMMTDSLPDSNELWNRIEAGLGKNEKAAKKVFKWKPYYGTIVAACLFLVIGVVAVSAVVRTGSFNNSTAMCETGKFASATADKTTSDDCYAEETATCESVMEEASYDDYCDEEAGDSDYEATNALGLTGNSKDQGNDNYAEDSIEESEADLVIIKETLTLEGFYFNDENQLSSVGAFDEEGRYWEFLVNENTDLDNILSLEFNETYTFEIMNEDELYYVIKAE